LPFFDNYLKKTAFRKKSTEPERKYSKTVARAYHSGMRCGRRWYSKREL